MKYIASVSVGIVGSREIVVIDPEKKRLSAKRRRERFKKRHPNYYKTPERKASRSYHYYLNWSSRRARANKLARYYPRPKPVPILEFYPYGTEDELTLRVVAEVPSSLPPDLREDICQSVIVRVLEGAKESLRELVKKVISDIYKASRFNPKWFSLDQRAAIYQADIGETLGMLKGVA